MPESDPVFGLRCTGLWGFYDHDSGYLKMSALSLFEDLTPSSLRLPKSGMMRVGRIYELRTLERPTGENGSGSWPSPHANSHTGPGSHGTGGDNLQTVVNWPTPTSKDHKDSGDCSNVPENGLLGRTVSPTKTAGSLNPEFCSWLMGYPKEWVNCEPSEIRSSRKSPK